MIQKILLLFLNNFITKTQIYSCVNAFINRPIKKAHKNSYIFNQVYIRFYRLTYFYKKISTYQHPYPQHFGWITTILLSYPQVLSAFAVDYGLVTKKTKIRLHNRCYGKPTYIFCKFFVVFYQKFMQKKWKYLLDK